MAHTQEPSELLERPPTTLRPALARLVAYYGGIGAIFVLAAWLMARFQAFSRTEATLEPPADLWGRLARLAPGWLEAGLYMIASVALVFPLVFVYLRTRTRAKFDHSLVQTVIVLPLAVTAILMMVRESLALAFSLAGVVAAIRFRNDLKESRDAVYIFTAIAIGFASGIRELGVALILSLLFCVLELVLWRLDLVEEYTASLRRMMTGESADQREPGRSGVVVEAFRQAWARERAAGGTLVAPPAAVPAQASDSPGAEPKPLHRLRIAVADADGARPEVEAVLEAETKRWAFVTREPGDDGGSILVYDVRLRKRTPADALAAEIRRRTANGVKAIE